MGSRVLIDTNLVIDLLRNVPQAASELRKHKDRAISIITWVEVMSGLREQEAQIIEDFEESFAVLPLTPAIAAETVKIRRS